MLLFSLISAISPVGAQTTKPNPTAILFEKSCYSCHNIGGGDKKGPDLMGVTQRRSKAWIHRYIPGPKALRDSGDPTAVQLFNKYAPEEMPDQTISPDQIDEILALIDDLTKRKKTFIPQSGRLVRPPRPADIPIGRAIFEGRIRLRNGGPPCISCHSVQGVGALGGGTLGFDLTNANTKYTDIELASILKAPAFPTMSKVFLNHTLTDEEVVKVFAYLQSAKLRTPDPARSGFEVLLVGMAGTLAAFGVASLVWRKRFHGVREELVERANKRVRAREAGRGEPGT